MGAAGARDDANIDFGLAKFSRLGGHNHIAGQSHFAAATQTPTTDGGNNRFANGCQLVKIADETLIQHADRCSPGHFFDVGSGGEGFLVTGKDHAANIAGCIENLQRLDQLAQ